MHYAGPTMIECGDGDDLFLVSSKYNAEKTPNCSKLIPFQNDGFHCFFNDFDLCLYAILPLSSGFSSFGFI